MEERMSTIDYYDNNAKMYFEYTVHMDMLYI
jgi:hypothetical protein